MSNQGRALISALNSGDYQSVDQYSDLSDLDIKIVNSHVHELFERAIRTENFKLFRAILKIPHVLVSGPEYCALRHATTAGLVEYVSELSRVKSVNANLQDKNGNTALMAAVTGKWTQKKALDLVRAIVYTGKIKTNIKDDDGRTALHYAMTKGWFDVANVLVDAGAHPKVEDSDGQTPLFYALTGQNVPADLFQKMLSYDGEAPEEEAEKADFTPLDDDAQALPAQNPFGQSGFQSTRHSTPGVQVTQNFPPDDPTPPIQKTQVVVDDFVKDEPPLQIDPTAVARNTPEDTESFQIVMEGQQIDDTLEKSFLFSPSSDRRYRLHRKAVTEQIGAILGQLTMTGESMIAADCARLDPTTGLNLWQAAALNGHFLDLLKAMARSKQFPSVADLTSRTEDGRRLADFLEESAQLSQVLNDSVWASQPVLLAHLLASLPERRIRSLSSLVARTNLLILEGGR